jgi:hypothetical protein
VPRGYTVVNSATLLAPNGVQTRGIVNCPAGLVPLGGGVFIQSFSTLANVNSSFPSFTSWVGDVNNASGADTTFHVQVICASAPRNYAVVQGDLTRNPSGFQTTALATCPAHSKPLGGGGLSDSGALFININSTLPEGRAWRVDENNATGSDANVAAFVVCGKVNGYTVVTGP